MQPRDRIRQALARDVKAAGRPALVAFVTAGYPEPREFLKVLRAVSGAADAIEIGVPFSDPMADGVTIQRASQHAIEHGVSLTWILDELGRRDFELSHPCCRELLETAVGVRLRRAREARGRSRRQRLHRAGPAL
jgi:tryptophan synthase alpha chain